MQCRGDIADLVGERSLDSANSRDGTLAVWFTPSGHPAHTLVNRLPTELRLNPAVRTDRILRSW